MESKAIKMDNEKYIEMSKRVKILIQLIIEKEDTFFYVNTVVMTKCLEFLIIAI